MQSVEALLKPISDEQTCGPYYEDDTALYGLFSQLEQAAKGKEDQVIRKPAENGSGEEEQIIPGQEPDWAEVDKLAETLFASTKDLRVAVYMTRAALARQGVKGLAQGVSLIRQLLESYWDTVHPQLVIDGDDDPDYRLNAVSELGNPDTLKLLGKTVLVESRAIGRYTLRDIRLAQGDLTPLSSDQNVATESHINAAFESAEPELLEANHGYLQQVTGDVQTILQIFTDKLGDQTPELKQLKQELEIAEKSYTQYGGGEAEEQAQSVDAPAAAGAPAQTLAVAAPGVIASRADVIKQIDLICDFYAKNEPSSPVPLILQRAKKMVDMDFMALLKDMAPSGISQAELLFGIKEEPAQPAASPSKKKDDW